MGKSLEGDVALPLVARVPARNRPLPVVALADGDLSRRLVADVPLDVGVDEVLRRHGEALRRRAEVLPVARRVQQVEGIERGAWGQRGPAQGDSVAGPSLGSGPRIDCGAGRRHGRIRAHGGVRVDVGHVGDERTVDRLADGDGDGIAAGNLDDLLPRAHRHRRSVDQVAVPVDLLQHQVCDVRPEVREAPRDARVVPDEDARQSGHRPSRDVVVARVVGVRAVHGGLVPQARHHRREVRVVGQQRLAGRRVLPAHHPGVGADARARPAEPGVQQPGGRDDASQRGPRARGSRRALHRCRCQGVLVEDPVDDRTTLDDRAVRLERVGREELLGLGDADRRGHHGAVHLVVHVPAQVPRQRLEPRHRVGGLPGLGLVVGVLQAEDGVLEADAVVCVRGQVGVHALRVRVEDHP